LKPIDKKHGILPEVSGDVSGWMAVVARNHSIDILRGNRPSDWIEDLAIASSYNLSIHAEQNLMCEEARVIMRKLSADQQRVLQLAFFEV
jgi:RNA polymerase sigma-70 factor (ECF subfamily)